MSWKHVCNVDDVGELEVAEFEVEGVKIVIARSSEGYHGLPPSCPHMEQTLVDAVVQDCTMTCTKHLWQWNLQSGAPMGLAEMPLKLYETKVSDGSVLINFEQELEYEFEDSDE